LFNITPEFGLKLEVLFVTCLLLKCCDTMKYCFLMVCLLKFWLQR